MFENNSKDSESQLGSPNSGDAKWTGPLKGPAQWPTKQRLVSGQPAPTAFSGVFELLSLWTLQIKELIVVSLLSYSCNLILTLILEVNYPTKAGFTVVSRLIQTPLWFARVPSTTNLASQFLNTSIEFNWFKRHAMHCYALLQYAFPLWPARICNFWADFRSGSLPRDAGDPRLRKPCGVMVKQVVQVSGVQPWMLDPGRFIWQRSKISTST